MFGLRTMKKTTTSITIAGVVLALTGCASSTDNVAEPTPAPTMVVTPSESSTTEATPTYTYTPTPISQTWLMMSDSEQEWICEHTDSQKQVEEFALWSDEAYEDSEILSLLSEACEGVKPEPTTVAKGDHEDISSRTWKKWAKDPDAHAGESIILYALVTQSDENMGLTSFRGDANTFDDRSYGTWDYEGQNTIFNGEEDTLSDVVTDDIVKVWATITGGLSYDTQMGGSATAVEVSVNHIKVIGQNG